MKYIVMILVFSFFPHLAFAQDEDKGMRFTYSLSFQLDSTNIDSKRKELFYLDVFDSNRYFISQYRYQYDSVFLATRDNNTMEQVKHFASNSSSRPLISKFPYIIKFEKDSFTYDEKVVLNSYVYKEPMPVIEWKVYPETKEIEGFACQKATAFFAGRDYIAWYTTEIPMQAAPYKLRGLPGVVVQVSDTKGHYQFDLHAMYSVEKNGIYNDTEGQKIVSKDELLEIKKKYQSNPALKYEEMGLVLGDPERLRKKAQERAKRENNPIELE